MVGIPFITSLLQRSLSSVIRKYTGGTYLPSATLKGIEYLKNPKFNKDVAFTLEERHSLGIHGLLPAAIRTQQEQLELCKIRLNRFNNILNKSLFLYDLQERNEKLFYRVLSENISELLPIVSTPTISQICEKRGLIFNQPRGLFISIYDRGHIPEVLMNWDETDVRIVIATDGENVNSLGDMGAHGMIFPVGKSILYTAISGIKPHQCLPITLDVGTNNEKLLKDPLYLGLRHRRTIGPTYLEFIDEFVESIIDRFGSDTIIQFEGFNRQNSLDFLKKYQKKCCFFSDELQCKGAITLAGLMASEAILNKPIKEYKMLFLGTDESTFSIANILVKYLQNVGLSAVEAVNRMWMFDEFGLLARTRTEGKLTGEKLIYAKDFEPSRNPIDVIKRVKPNVLIGTLETGKWFKPDVLFKMAEVNNRPLILALGDPNCRNECLSEDVYHHTQGRAIFASSSTSPEENYSKNCIPGQATSCLVYPGIALGALTAGLRKITDDIFPLAARCIAEKVTKEDLKVGRIFPNLTNLKKCSIDLATKVCEYSYKEGIATFYPEPEDKKSFIETQLYDYEYESFLNRELEWIEMAETATAEVKKGYYNRMKDYVKQFNEISTESPKKFVFVEDKGEEIKEEEDVDDKNSEDVEDLKRDLDDIKIVERTPPETYKTKPDPTT